MVALLTERLGLEGASVAEQREVLEASAALFPVASDVQVAEVDARGVPSDWLTIGAEPGSVLRPQPP